MDEIDRTPEEASEGRDSPESSEQKTLDDATLDPGMLIEQSGDIRQVESVQEAFTSVVENAGDPSGQVLKMAGEPFEQVSGSGEDGGGEATLNNLPDVLPGIGEKNGISQIYLLDIQSEAGLETTKSIETLRETGRTLRAMSAQPVAEELSASNKQKMQASNQGLVDIADRIDQLAEQWEGTCTSTELKHETKTGLSDLTSERQLQLQQLMEKKTQIEQTLSSVLKTFENTQQDLVGNLK